MQPEKRRDQSHDRARDRSTENDPISTKSAPTDLRAHAIVPFSSVSVVVSLWRLCFLPDTTRGGVGLCSTLLPSVCTYSAYSKFGLDKIP